MPANTIPIFPLGPTAANVPTGKTIATFNTAVDGTGVVVGVFTAGANGGRLDFIKFLSLGTNIQTVARVFLNNGSTNVVMVNNTMIAQITLPATALDNTAALTEKILNLDISIPAGYVVNVTIGTTVAAGYALTAFGGDY